MTSMNAPKIFIPTILLTAGCIENRKDTLLDLNITIGISSEL